METTIKSWKTKKNELVIYSILFCLSFILYFRLLLIEETDMRNHMLFLSKNVEVYSLIDYIMGGIYMIFRNHVGSFFIASIFAFATCMSVRTAAKTVRFLLRKHYNEKVALIISLLSHVVMAIFIPNIVQYRYLGVWAGAIWHNPTYIFMRIFALMFLNCFLNIYIREFKNITKKDYVHLTIFMFASVLGKPNFLVIFAPILGVILCQLLYKSHGKAIKKVIGIGLTTIPSAALIVFQYMVLFKTDASGIAIIPFDSSNVWNVNPFFSLLFAVAFPLMILITHLVKLKNDKIFSFSWGLWLSAYLQYSLVAETGMRRTHSNWAWGYMYMIFHIFLVSISIFYIDIVNAIKCKKINWGYLLLGFFLLLLHLQSGISFFISFIQTVDGLLYH